MLKNLSLFDLCNPDLIFNCNLSIENCLDLQLPSFEWLISQHIYDLPN